MSRAERCAPRIYHWYACTECGWRGSGGENLKRCGSCRRETLTRA